jgi:hypothetical protein
MSFAIEAVAAVDCRLLQEICGMIFQSSCLECWPKAGRPATCLRRERPSHQRSRGLVERVRPTEDGIGMNPRHHKCAVIHMLLGLPGSKERGGEGGEGGGCDS